MHREEMSSQIPIKLPVDVDNDEQAAVLYSPFRGKNANPTSYASKMKFWQRSLEHVAMEKRLITIDLNCLPQLFMRKGLTPKCFPTVVEELQRLGKVVAFDDYKKKNSWISWGFSALVKDPLSWGVSQMFGSPKKISSVFVWPDVLQKVAAEILSHLQSNIRQGIIGHVISYAKCEELCSHILTTKEHFDLVVNYLQTDKKMHVEQTEQYGHLVKICEDSKTSVSPLKITDKHIFEINAARLKVENEINTLSTGLDTLRMEAKDYLKENKRGMALHCLRKKKRLDKVIMSKSSTLYNLEEILNKIQDAETNMIVVQACEKGLSVLKKLNEENNPDKVESVMEEINEAIQDAEDVTAAIQSVGPEADEDLSQLEEELAVLMSGAQKPLESKDSLSDDLAMPDLASLSLSDLDLPEVPTHSPSSSKVKSPSEKEVTPFLSS